MPEYRIAVDVGGTFTDIVLIDEQGTLAVAKVPWPPDPVEGVPAPVDRAEVPLDQAVFFSHGTTVATNALITRRLPRAAMVTTRGFRDVIEIRRANKEDLWDVYKDVARPYIPRRDRVVVAERVDAGGNVVTSLD